MSAALSSVRRVTKKLPWLVLVDGQNLLWRAAYGFPARIRTRAGEDVTAPFGFFALLRKGLRDFGQPSECVVIFDGESGWTERLIEFPDYKSARREADFSPLSWLSALQSGLTDLGIGWQESVDCEADDVIATLAGSVRRRVAVMSTDKDFHQLLSPRVSQLNTARGQMDRLISDLDVIERFRVAPDQWCDYVAMVGDRSDGIPGIRGIGRKRAAVLLDGGVHLEDLASMGRLAGAHGRRLHEEFDVALRWRSLVQLRIDAHVTVGLTGRPTPELPLAARVLEAQEIW
jgi:DNA polymerase-1